MPKRTYITKDKKSVPGHKPSKDRLTFLLRANACGDMKLKPLPACHSDNPRAFKIFKNQRKTSSNMEIEVYAPGIINH